MFKTELHCHSNDISSCARVSTQDIINKFCEAGYSTLVLTNHFSQYTYDFVGAKSWDEWIDKFVGAYEKLKNEALGKLNILLGLELRLNDSDNDYLVFGATEEFLRKIPHVFDLWPEDFHRLANENGCLFVQAHPFRNHMKIKRPDCLDGVEVFNGHFGHDSRNDIAELWAEKYNLIKTSGTDFHYNDSPANGGIFTEKEITTLEQLVEILKSGNYTLNRQY